MVHIKRNLKNGGEQMYPTEIEKSQQWIKKKKEHGLTSRANFCF